MYIFKLIYFVIFIANVQKSRCQISDKRLCVDETCSAPISRGKTLLLYPSSSEGILSFKQNEDVTVYSKEAGSRTDLWGVEINGRRGYVPKEYVRETKVLNKATLLVDTEAVNSPKVPSSNDESLVPSQVTESYQVIDGTTIYDSPAEAITPTPTVATPLATSTLVHNINEGGNASVDQINNDGAAKTDQGVVGGVISAFTRKDTESDLNEMVDDEDDDEEDDEYDGDDDEEEENDELKPQVGTENSTSSGEESVNHSELREDNFKVDVPILIPYNQQVDPKVIENVLKDDASAETMSSKESDPKADEVPVGLSENVKETPDTVMENSIKDPVVNVPHSEVKEEFIASAENLNVKQEEQVSQIPIKEDLIPDPSILNTIVKPKGVEDNMNVLDDDITVTTQVPALEPIAVEKNVDIVNINTPEVLPKETEEPLQQPVSDITTTTQVPAPELGVPPPIINIDDVTISPLQTEIRTEAKVEESPVLEEQLSQHTENSVDPGINEDKSISDTRNSLEDDNAVPKTQADIPNNANDGVIPVPESNVEGSSSEAAEKNIEEPSLFGGWFGNSNSPPEETEAQSDEAFTNVEEPPKDEVIEETVETQIPTETPEVSVTDKPTLESVTTVEKLNKPTVESDVADDGGFLSNLFSFFGNNEEAIPEDGLTETENNVWTQESQDERFESCSVTEKQDHLLNFKSDIFLYLITTAISCIIFLFLYLMMEKSRREGPLIAKINKLEKDLFVMVKEYEMLQEQQPSAVTSTYDESIVEDLNNRLSQMSEIKDILERQVEELNLELEKRQDLEEQIESLEKELETSTEVGMELNRIISEMLDPMNGSEKLKENVEQLQRQLLEQKETISTTQRLLSIKETENEALQIDIAEYKKKISGMESQLDQLLEKVVSIEKEKEEQHGVLHKEICLYQQKYADSEQKVDLLNNEIQTLNTRILEVQRVAELKTKEYNILKEDISKIKSMDNNSNLDSLLDVSLTKAQLEQLKSENERYTSQLQQEQILKTGMERKYSSLMEEIESLRQRYEDSDKERTEATMKLEVLNNYFKKRESELQEEVLKYKSIFEAKQGAATSTSERIKLMLEEIENYKSQNETLKQEILSQEIDLKSQISVLEKKVHENWVIARQTERKLEDAKQEAAQLRNRLTMRERAFIEERTQNRLQSPIDQNGESAMSPHPSLDSPTSPPPLFGTNNRDHITKSPPLAGLPPPPFLPPLPGAPFMPPPLPRMPPFMPPPPNVYPGDHRPPPLGRMSSPPPPLNSRYSPDMSAFSPYDRNSPSPYDSEYGTTPPVRGYSPFNGRDDRRDYGRQPHSRSNNRNKKGPTMSSGSDHSNDSLDKHHRKQSKMV